jgi:hypothetical protein
MGNHIAPSSHTTYFHHCHSTSEYIFQFIFNIRMPAMQNLQAIGARVRSQFHCLINQGRGLGEHEYPLTIEADRYELWVVNLGLFASAHASLDYRVRDADIIKDALSTFLTDLYDALDEGK